MKEIVLSFYFLIYEDDYQFRVSKNSETGLHQLFFDGDEGRENVGNPFFNKPEIVSISQNIEDYLSSLGRATKGEIGTLIRLDWENQGQNEIFHCLIKQERQEFKCFRLTAQKPMDIGEPIKIELPTDLVSAAQLINRHLRRLNAEGYIFPNVSLEGAKN